LSVDRRFLTPAGRAGLLVIAAIALRWWDWGNPVIHVDEQWYLLVGERMRAGAVPYIDLWDRKPIGLFLLYAAMAALPGGGILGYQLVATAFAAATAIVVDRIARLTGAAARGGLAAGLLYLVALELLGGRGGQSPVFYNLFVAAAAWLAIALPQRLAAGGRGIVASGTLACLLCGVAIQMKYTPVFEGAFVGLAHVWAYARSPKMSGARWAGGLAAMCLWIVAGVAPTAAAMAWYGSHGWLASWWFANVTSIGLRAGYPAAELAMRLLGISAQLSPLMFAAAVGWRRRPRTGPRAAATTLALVWLAAALVGFLAIGTFFDHYALPLVAPLAVMAARTLGRSTRTLVACLGLMLLLFAVERLAARRDGPGARAVAAVVAANSAGRGCPYVFIGDTITYHLAHACLPTAYAFPNLLAYATEQGATGIDEAAEVRRILAARPAVIVTSTRRLAIWNQGSVRAEKAALARDYRPVFSVPRETWRTVVFLRRDLAYRP
jgi:hypothetical protein